METLLQYRDVGAIVINVMLVVFGALGLYAFFPIRAERINNAAAWLLLAIWLGFAAALVNVLAWKIVGPALFNLGLIENDMRRWIGIIFGDILGKGGAVIAIYLHFYARWKALPDDERAQWSPMTMFLYPDNTSFMYRTLRFWYLARTKRNSAK